MIATPVWFDDAVQPIATALLTAWPAAGWLDFKRLPLTLDDLAGPTGAEIERHAGASVTERACASR